MKRWEGGGKGFRHFVALLFPSPTPLPTLSIHFHSFPTLPFPSSRTSLTALPLPSRPLPSLRGPSVPPLPPCYHLGALPFPSRPPSITWQRFQSLPPPSHLFIAVPTPSLPATLPSLRSMSVPFPPSSHLFASLSHPFRSLHFQAPQTPARCLPITLHFAPFYPLCFFSSPFPSLPSPSVAFQPPSHHFPALQFTSASSPSFRSFGVPFLPHSHHFVALAFRSVPFQHLSHHFAPLRSLPAPFPPPLRPSTPFPSPSHHFAPLRLIPDPAGLCTPSVYVLPIVAPTKHFGAVRYGLIPALPPGPARPSCNHPVTSTLPTVQ